MTTARTTTAHLSTGHRSSGRPAARAVSVVLALVLAATLGACAGGSPSADDSGSPVAARPGSWPDAASTGARGPLKTRPSVTIIEDGAVLANTLVRGQVTIEADDVTLRNVRVESAASYGILVWGRRARILDSTVKGTRGRTLAGVAAYRSGSFTARRVNVHGSEDGVRLGTNCALLDSYVHDLAGGPEAHFDAVTADGYRGWRIEGNRIWNPHGQTAAVWVGDPRYAASEGLLKGNLLAGGGYTVYGGHSTGRGIRVVDNVFSRRYFPRSGRFGPVSYWQARGNVWSGNRWQGGGAVRP